MGSPSLPSVLSHAGVTTSLQGRERLPVALGPGAGQGDSLASTAFSSSGFLPLGCLHCPHLGGADKMGSLQQYPKYGKEGINICEQKGSCRSCAL